MAEKVNKALFKSDVNGVTYYEALPDFNVSKDLTRVTNVQEARDYATSLRGQGTYRPGDRSGPSFDVQDVANRTDQAISQLSGDSGYVLDSNPAGKDSPFTTQKALNSQQAQRDAIASGASVDLNAGKGGPTLTVPKGTPTPQQSNAVFQAGQPTPREQVASGAQGGQYNHPAIKTRDLIMAGQPITVWKGSNPSGGISYQIKSGDNLTTIAAQFNTTVDKILEANGLGGTPPSGTVLPSGTSDITTTTEDDRAATDKAEAETEKTEADKAAETEKKIVDLTNKKTIADLENSLGITGDAPLVPTYKDNREALRSEKGLEAIETRLTALNKDIADTEASLRLGKYDEEGKLRPMELIGTRQREMDRQAQEGLDALNRDKAVLIDEYNIKNRVISDMMKDTEMDYNAARNAYNDKFSQAINLQQLMNQTDAQEANEENQIRDDARANLTVYQNMFKDKSVSWSSLSAENRASITALELKAGFPTGTMRSFIEAKPKAKLLSSSTGFNSAGQGVTTFIYEDENGMPGTVEVVGTGSVKAPSGSDSTESQDQLSAATKYVTENLSQTDEKINIDLRIKFPKITDGDITAAINEGRNQRFITEEWIRNKYSEKQLKDRAYSAGHKEGGSWFFGAGVGKEGIQNYIDNRILEAGELRKDGLTDKEIIDLQDEEDEK